MRITVVPGCAFGADLVMAWSGLQKQNATLSSPFFSPFFTQIIAATKNNVEVAVIEQAGKIQAFLPFERFDGGIGRAVGAGISDYHGLVSSGDFCINPRLLLNRSRLRCWEFDHLPFCQKSFSKFHLWIESSPQIDLSRGFDAYVTEIREAGSEQIKKLGNLRRRIEREVGPLRFVPASTDRAALAKVLQWKSQQYLETGKDDIFRSRWISDAIERMFALNDELFSGVLSVLYAGDCLVAGHFGIKSVDTWHYWFPAYDPKFRKYSPGLLLLIEMAANAGQTRVQTIDLGKGTTLYKQRLSNAGRELAVGRVEARWRFVPRKILTRARFELSNTSVGAPMRRILYYIRNWKNHPGKKG